MPKEKRPHTVKFKVTDEEFELIQAKRKRLGICNMSAYLRVMAINGFVLIPSIREVQELIPLLRNMTNNVNQLAQRVNAGGNVYETELEEIKDNQKTLWEILRQVLQKLTVTE